MRAKEFITERFNYAEYIPAMHWIIQDTFDKVTQADEYDDYEAKINDFFFQVENSVNQYILKPFLEANPITEDGVEIKTLTLSFAPTFKKPIGKINVAKTSAKIHKAIQNKFPGDGSFKPGIQGIAKYVKNHMDFTGECSYDIDTDAKAAMIEIPINGTEIGNFLFANEHSEIVTASLHSLKYKVTGMFMHELKHFLVNRKVTNKFGQDSQVNRFYVGDYKTMDKNEEYGKGGPAYWLNADELSSHAANIAAELYAVFGDNKNALMAYLNAVSGGSYISYDGMPVNSALKHYHHQIFTPTEKLNTDPKKVWRKLIKNVAGDLAMYYREHQ